MLIKKFSTLFLLITVGVFLTSCSDGISNYKFFNKEHIKVALVLPQSISNSPTCREAYNGLKRIKQDYKAEIGVVEKVNQSEARKVFIALAKKKFDLIITLDYKQGQIMKQLARMYPETFFCIVNGSTSQSPNLCSFNFKDEQYGYLIGAVAGLNTSTNKAGIVIQGKSPSTRKIVLGMRRGLQSINPKADLLVSYIKKSNDISAGKEAALVQINSGVDVIAHHADISGIGVIKAAEEADILAIGSVEDQHDLAPNIVITSGIKDISQLVYLACEKYIEKKLEPINYYFGLKDQVIDLAPSYGNVDPTTEAKINQIKTKLTDLESEDNS